MRDKKAQGMSLKIIIIAVIALIVLVVLIISFTGKYRIFGKSTVDCGNKGGACAKVGTPECSRDTHLVYGNTNCNQNDDDKKDCCVKM
ncbi:hypothetical protein ACFL0V_04780 [Nanoarchaeota archaeon]